MLPWISDYWPIAPIVLALFLLSLICYYLHKAHALKQSQLIFKMGESFTFNEQMQSLYTKLQLQNDHKHDRLQPNLNETDTPLIIAYLNFFVVIYQLHLERAIGFKQIDHMFAVPFFIAINNRYIQQYLLADDDYCTIILLYERWLAYRRKHKLSEPFSEQSLSILLGRSKS